MLIDKNITDTVLTFHEEMMKGGVSLVYLGEFNQEITKMFTSMAQEEMGRKQVGTVTRKRVYHVLVETLQNMTKHSDELTDGNIGKGLFIVGQKEDAYYILTLNKVSEEKKNFLTKSIELINNASKEELKEMYITQIRDGSLSAKGGAGLGLIDIARKTGNKYRYKFLPVDHDYHFILQIEVSA